MPQGRPLLRRLRLPFRHECKGGRGAAPGVEAHIAGAPAPAPRPVEDVDDVKERGRQLAGAVVTGVGAHATRTRAGARMLSAHELGLWGLRLVVVRVICPPA